jgi:hypothetical protein
MIMTWQGFTWSTRFPLLEMVILVFVRFDKINHAKAECTSANDLRRRRPTKLASFFGGVRVGEAGLAAGAAKAVEVPAAGINGREGRFIR